MVLVETLFYGGVCAQASPDPQQAVVQGRRGGHSYTVRFEAKPFERRWYKITGHKNEPPTIDGEPQDYMPQTELRHLDVTVDGMHWQVPVRLWKDCFDPILRAGERPQAWLSQNRKLLRVKMHGSDAVGSYDVTWRLRSDGRDSRKVHFHIDDENS